MQTKKHLQTLLGLCLALSPIRFCGKLVLSLYSLRQAFSIEDSIQKIILLTIKRGLGHKQSKKFEFILCMT